MTSRTNSILLATLNPEEVAISTLRLILKQAEALYVAVAGWKAFDSDPRRMPLFQKLVDTIYFAQSGQYPADAGRRLDEIGRAVYGSAASPTIRPLSNQGTAIGCAFIAANGRIELSKRRPISHHALAALSGVTVGKAQAIAAQHRAPGTTSSTMMLPAPALAWLVSQHVPGFETP